MKTVSAKMPHISTQAVTAIWSDASNKAFWKTTTLTINISSGLFLRMIQHYFTSTVRDVEFGWRVYTEVYDKFKQSGNLNVVTTVTTGMPC